jgi:hypothetical protein
MLHRLLGLIVISLCSLVLVAQDYDPSDSCVFDEVEALLAGLVCDVKSCSLAGFETSLEDGVVFCVDGVAGEEVVISSCTYLLIATLSSGTTTIRAMCSSRCNPVESIADHLPIPDDHGPHLTAGARGHR